MYTKKLYTKLQRKGLLERDVDRLIRNDRVIWGSSMLSVRRRCNGNRKYQTLCCVN